jgi:hypothetical protein
MHCPFGSRSFEKWEMDMWHPFACPKCHKWLRVRRNYTARIMRLFLTAVLVAAALYLAGLREPIHLGRTVIIAVIPISAALEQGFLYLLPARIESATAGELDLVNFV